MLSAGISVVTEDGVIVVGSVIDRVKDVVGVGLVTDAENIKTNQFSYRKKCGGESKKFSL